MTLKILGSIFLIVAIFLVVMVLYNYSNKDQTPLLFSPTQVLNTTWDNYKRDNLETGTFRTLDKQRNYITTSEGQSYTMLRAVWQGDKQTFDKSWLWTKNNLQHKKDDALFAWLFGKQANGSYGILTGEGGKEH